MYFGMPCGSDCFLMRATAGGGFSNVVDLYDLNQTVVPPPPSPPLPPAVVAAIVICVLADLLHAFFFIRRVRSKLGSLKAWVLACIMLGPLVWIVWWCRQRAVRSADTSSRVTLISRS